MKIAVNKQLNSILNYCPTNPPKSPFSKGDLSIDMET
jgi:hypothetical protein